MGEKAYLVSWRGQLVGDVEPLTVALVVSCVSAFAVDNDLAVIVVGGHEGDAGGHAIPSQGGTVVALSGWRPVVPAVRDHRCPYVLEIHVGVGVDQKAKRDDALIRRVALVVAGGEREFPADPVQVCGGDDLFGLLGSLALGSDRRSSGVLNLHTG